MRKRYQWILLPVVLFPALLTCIPVLILITGSIMGEGELNLYLAPVLMEKETLSGWKLIPDYPTFSHYGKLLFMTPQFFVLFWNSVKLSGIKQIESDQHSRSCHFAGSFFCLSGLSLL